MSEFGKKFTGGLVTFGPVFDEADKIRLQDCSKVEARVMVADLERIYEENARQKMSEIVRSTRMTNVGSIKRFNKQHPLTMAIRSLYVY